MSILSIEKFDTAIIFRNKEEGQVVRIFFQIYETEKLDNVIEGVTSRLLISISRLFVNYEYRKKGWASIILNNLFETYPDSTFLLNAYPDEEKYMSKEILLSFYQKFNFKVVRPTEDGMLLIKKP